MDYILYWNEAALEANKVSHTNGKKEQTGPTLSSRALAMVHLAMYEAYARITNTPATLPFYYPAAMNVPAPPAGASASAAVSAAAHSVLSKLFESQKSFFDRKHEEAMISGGGVMEGHAYGLLIAQIVLKDRQNDPDASNDGYAYGTARSNHRPDPDNHGQGNHAPFYGAKSKGFAITQRWELLKPPFDNAEYRRALKEVLGKGISPALMGTLSSSITKRTYDETLIGLYWGYDGAPGLGTPPRLYNQIVRQIAINKANTESDNARLFALVNIAMGDAGILAWDQKYVHNLWRPVVGIREHDTSMGWDTAAGNNINNDCDPGWLPLGAPATNTSNPNVVPQQTAHAYPYNQITSGKVKNFTPNFPAYPSGHATFGAAALHITRLFYGVPVNNRAPDTLFNGLYFVSEELNGQNQDNEGTVRPRHARNFSNGLWQMIEENGRSRVYLGVHWVFDAFAVKANGQMDLSKMVGGVPLGLKIAEDIFSSGMTQSPVMPRY